MIFLKQYIYGKILMFLFKYKFSHYKYYVINKTRLYEYENDARISMKRDGKFKQMCRQETNLHFEKRHYKIN